MASDWVEVTEAIVGVCLVDDQDYDGVRFGPTMGAYVETGARSVRYLEKGWAHDFKTGNPAGSLVCGPEEYTVVGAKADV